MVPDITPTDDKATAIFVPSAAPSVCLFVNYRYGGLQQEAFFVRHSLCNYITCAFFCHFFAADIRFDDYLPDSTLVTIVVVFLFL